MNRKMATQWRHDRKTIKKVLDLGLIEFSGAIDGARTHEMPEPQSGVLTNFTTTAIRLIIVLYL